MSSPSRPRLTLLSLLLAVGAALVHSACAPLVVGGAMVGTAMVAVDRRTAGAQVEDQSIELKAAGEANRVSPAGHVSVTSYNRIVLLSGEVPSETDRKAVEQAVARLENLRSVVNELAVAGNSSLGQRSTDSITSGKVKAAMVDAKDLQAAAIKVGDPLDPATRFGAMVSQAQMNTALRYIETAQSEGAHLKLGGARAREETGGYYVEPTVFSGVAPGSTLAREEVFGPVLAMMTFKTADEAFALANDTQYGLAAGAWTANVDLAFAAAKRLRAGLVWVNGWDICDITMPFGGFKQSGFGRDRSLHALHKYADLKAVSFALRGRA